MMFLTIPLSRHLVRGVGGRVDRNLPRRVRVASGAGAAVQLASVPHGLRNGISLRKWYAIYFIYLIFCVWISSFFWRGLCIIFFFFFLKIYIFSFDSYLDCGHTSSLALLYTCLCTFISITPTSME